MNRQQKLFSSWNDLFNGAGAYFNTKVPIYSFDGRDILYDPNWPQKIIWHGSDVHGQRMPASYCNAWDSKSIEQTGFGSSLLKNKLLDLEKFSCNNAFILLCIEITSREDVKK
ncbi:Collagen alpha-1(XV) chain [Lamellibrachia satsuma]|nr:Collagen alpha-1(XV) chain [Lamellibrachia satsuma]